MNFMGMGPAELVLILIIAVIVLGPGKLPEVARALGKTMREFRSITDGFQSELRKEIDSASSTIKEDAKPLSDLSNSLSSIRSSLNSPLAAASAEAEKALGVSAADKETDIKESADATTTTAASTDQGVGSVPSDQTDNRDDSLETAHQNGQRNESDAGPKTTDAGGTQQVAEGVAPDSGDDQPLEYTLSASEPAEQD